MGKKIPFDSNTDIPDLSGKVIIVTGGNSGLGKETVLQLAKHNPHLLYMGARSKAKAEEAIAEIKTTVPNANIKFLEIDISSLSSVKRGADAFLAENDRLDILVNNAGVMGLPPGLTEDGYESQFGTNHMGPALFTKLLLPTLQKTSLSPNADVRIVNISSEALKFGPPTGLVLAQNKTSLASLSGAQRYGQSKLANLYFSQILAKKYPNIKTNAIHPGMVRTGITTNTTNNYWYLSWVFAIGFKMFLLNIHDGAKPQLFAATGKKEVVKSGAFYFPGVSEWDGNAITKNSKLADELWNWTEAELKSKGY
ncbi:hypothetical protein BCIN_13g00130 [Botrytis cinerea B05.10]|uniref:NAD(P)-binding protein n=2 Tax=Botryotinia fuckeliana TaxID=40559 RepID=A0A384K005_BOTFB|nr:hypothetical protein BCIN_13g00130 [Botrytis cinerea B05.10]ATZ56165.1 hypothetical protein BCIN_13g00130 [Botrytis cinerea B05.10]EMR90687.1 putative retinol dehydrogenase protein [Botrytis cinerea BcDW1]